MNDISRIQLRPGMYVGDTTDGTGLHRLVIEVVAASLVGALGGHIRQIEVVLNVDRSCSVRDDGAGLPVDLDGPSGRSSMEAMFTDLLWLSRQGECVPAVAGDIFVGLPVVNALSDWLEVVVVRTNQYHCLCFKAGAVDRDLTVSARPSSRPRLTQGTEVTFLPSHRYFQSTGFKASRLADQLQILSRANGNAPISLTDLRDL